MRGFTTSEGYWLPEPIALDDVHSFDELLNYEGAWHKDAKPADTAVTGNAPHAAQALLGTGERVCNRLTGYCTIDASQIGGDPFRSIAVTPTDQLLAALDGKIATSGQRLNFKIVVHAGRMDENGDVMEPRALIITRYDQLAASIWLAYVDAATLPAEVPSSVPAEW